MKDYYVIADYTQKNGPRSAFWWGPLTKEEANDEYLKRSGMYDTLKIVFDITP